MRVRVGKKGEQRMLSKPAIETQIGRKQTSINIMGLIQAAREHGRAEGVTA